jgi:glycosyltransferase involved in cell wall biosynthesis
MSKPVLTVLIPVFNESRNIEAVAEAVFRVWQGIQDYAPEIIFVDDGSRDATWLEISKAVSARPEAIRGIRFTRNFGKEAAIEAGLREATGEAIVMIDGDLQHPPELIPEFIATWKAGYEVVRAANENPPHKGAFKKLTSSLFYRFLNFVSDTPIEPGSSDFCLISRTVADKLNSLSEREKFHRILTKWTGYKTAVIPYTARDRHAGATVYTTRKLFALARIAVISSSTIPMTAIFVAGVALSAIGILLVLGLLIYKFFVDFEYIGGSIILGAFIILDNGLLLLALGVMSLYQMAMYRTIQNRPTYLVSERI